MQGEGKDHSLGFQTYVYDILNLVTVTFEYTPCHVAIYNLSLWAHGYRVLQAQLPDM